MALSCFDDKSLPPDECRLRAALGASAAAWDKLQLQVQAGGPLELEWAFPGPSFGWSLRLRRSKRILLYLTPQRDFFHVGIVLGERAAAAALADASLPAEVRQALGEARPYAEGRGLRLPCRTENELAPLLRLLEHKTA